MMTKANTKYKTVKRKANVGERILITESDMTFGDYRNGQVFTVSEDYGSRAVRVTEIGLPCIFHREYEVIIDDSERITALETQVAELKAELQALKKRKKPKHLLSHYPTPNEQRKAVIERAKAFVAEVSERAKGDYSNDIGNVIYRHRTTRPEFHVNAKKRTVVVLLKGAHNPVLIGKAIAKCAPDDVFNADIGKAIALGRALGLDVSEFENAPKPTEVVVGMVVDTYIDGDFFKTVKPMKVIEGHRMYSNLITAEYTPYDPGDKITDDTDAQY